MIKSVLCRRTPLQPPRLLPLPLPCPARLYLRPLPFRPSRHKHQDSRRAPTGAAIAGKIPTNPAIPATPQRPPSAPKPLLNFRHIRENPDLYRRNCLDRNYPRHAENASRIADLYEQWSRLHHAGRELRQRTNQLSREIAAAVPPPPSPGSSDDAATTTARKEALLGEARAVKDRLAELEPREKALAEEMEALALAVPNLTMPGVPRGLEPRLLTHINGERQDDGVAASHVDIGTRLGILDFAAAAATSGWGWYFLVGVGAQLEHALTQYALAMASQRGWTMVSPPSVVYSHIAAGCGFQPRDQNDEQQIYTLAAPPSSPGTMTSSPELCLTGTAEISLAGMSANTTLHARDLPVRRVAASRCFRAEAGSRGVGSKGLYRVHEFTKVELFAWTMPDHEAASAVFEDMLDMQAAILGSLGLRCRLLEMPTADLGASAARKCDVEAFFPSRRYMPGAGWGEVTSASICTDYQTRRLGTRLRFDTAAGTPEADGASAAGELTFPWTANGTALAVPRVVAALLENNWDEATGTVTIPECLHQYMGGMKSIGPAAPSRAR